jgi:uncharacterized peroxidase-related enzyme
MPRINPVNPETASGKAKDLLDGVRKKLGATPNLLTTMANAPAVLEGYLNLSGALGSGGLSPKIREQIAIGVAAANACDYCLAAHTTIGKGAGVSEADLAGAQTGDVSDPKAEGVLRLARTIVDKGGKLSDDDLRRARADDLTDAEILEVAANIVLNFYTNFINHIAGTEVDFPSVENRLHAVA